MKTFSVHRHILPIVLVCLLHIGSMVFVRAQTDTLSGFLQSQEAAARVWLDNIYSHGVEIKGDSVHFNDETRLISSDSTYRNLIYPEKYTWEVVAGLLQRKILKPSFWYLINIFHTDTASHDMVLKLIVPLDKTLEMDRALLAAFYTYIPFDPEVYTLQNGKTVEVRRPDIAEHKLLATKEMVDYILANRSLKQSTPGKQ